MFWVKSQLSVQRTENSGFESVMQVNYSYSLTMYFNILVVKYDIVGIKTECSPPNVV